MWSRVSKLYIYVYIYIYIQSKIYSSQYSHYVIKDKGCVDVETCSLESRVCKVHVSKDRDM